MSNSENNVYQYHRTISSNKYKVVQVIPDTCKIMQVMSDKYKVVQVMSDKYKVVQVMSDKYKVVQVMSVPCNPKVIVNLVMIICP